MTDGQDPLVFLDPTSERDPIGRHPAVRQSILTGTIGLVDISKPRGDVFLDEVERLVSERYPSVDVMCPTPSKTQPTMRCAPGPGTPSTAFCEP